MTPFKSKLISLLNLMVLACCPACIAQPITLDVAFKLTDINYQPLPNVPVRLVLGSDSNWQSPNSGYNFVTDEKGEAHITAKAALDKRMRKVPTNYIADLLSLPHPRPHLLIGADLVYKDVRALYMIDLVVLPGGTTMQDDFLLHAADDKGQFTRTLQPSNYYLIRPDMKAMVLQGPGFTPSDFLLLPDPADSTGKKWTLRLAFKQSAPPVNRD